VCVCVCVCVWGAKSPTGFGGKQRRLSAAPPPHANRAAKRRRRRRRIKVSICSDRRAGLTIRADLSDETNTKMIDCSYLAGRRRSCLLRLSHVCLASSLIYRRRASSSCRSGASRVLSRSWVMTTSLALGGRSAGALSEIGNLREALRDLREAAAFAETLTVAVVAVAVVVVVVVAASGGRRRNRKRHHTTSLVAQPPSYSYDCIAPGAV
jgi:hypothetical protein